MVELVCDKKKKKKKKKKRKAGTVPPFPKNFRNLSNLSQKIFLILETFYYLWNFIRIFEKNLVSIFPKFLRNFKIIFWKFLHLKFPENLLIFFPPGYGSSNQDLPDFEPQIPNFETILKSWVTFILLLTFTLICKFNTAFQRGLASRYLNLKVLHILQFFD